MARLVILTHEYDRRSKTQAHLVGSLIEHWEHAGHSVAIAPGPAAARPADAALLHVDLTVVPAPYLEAMRRYPVGLNRDVTDISKRTVSRLLVASPEACDGPVIVKTDLNSGGMPERIKRNRGFRLGRLSEPPLLVSPVDYPIYASAREVPEAIWSDPRLVVERFLPEVEGDEYCIRYYYFLGAAEACFRYRSRNPLVKSATVHAHEEIEVPEALRARRREMGFDYGKFDYVMRDGKPILLDANFTPVKVLLEKFGQLARVAPRLAAGLDALLARR